MDRPVLLTPATLARSRQALDIVQAILAALAGVAFLVSRLPQAGAASAGYTDQAPVVAAADTAAVNPIAVEMSEPENQTPKKSR